jgi:hypothetical protein
MFFLLPDNAVTPRDEVQAVSRLIARAYLYLALVSTKQLPYQTGVSIQRQMNIFRQKDYAVATQFIFSK